MHASVQRAAVRAAVVQAYSQWNPATAAVTSNEMVKSAETALRGVRDEAPRPAHMLDVLNARQALLEVRVDSSPPNVMASSVLRRPSRHRKPLGPDRRSRCRGL